MVVKESIVEARRLNLEARVWFDNEDFKSDPRTHLALLQRELDAAAAVTRELDPRPVAEALLTALSREAKVNALQVSYGYVGVVIYPDWP